MPTTATAACSTSSARPRATTYCDEVKGTLAQHGLQITELSTHLQGQLVAVHPAYDAADGRLRAAGTCAASRPRAPSGRCSS